MYSNNNVFLTHKKNQLIPLNDPRRKLVGKTILFTNARDEKNIKEWVAHHLILGFDLIYIFDHKSIIPISRDITNFKKGVIVERCEMDGPIKMHLMLKASKIATSAGADWMLYLDADEFLVLNAFQHVKQMLKYYLMADSLAINWLLFGTNNYIKDPEDGLIIENYTKSDERIDKHVKTFVRPSQVVDAVTPHYFVIVNPSRMISINMVSMSNSRSFNEWPIEYNKCPAFIAHYAYQSEESYIKRKINLPRDDNNLYRKIEDNIHEKHNSTENELVKNKYATGVKWLLEKIKH
uniref:Glycosyltransferase family 92 protein n=1 Tax=viral metagenome TaxID=1070528 RepID=A0A6C0K399_9ZZZZ